MRGSAGRYTLKFLDVAETKLIKLQVCYEAAGIFHSLDRPDTAGAYLQRTLFGNNNRRSAQAVAKCRNQPFGFSATLGFSHEYFSPLSYVDTF